MRLWEVGEGEDVLCRVRDQRGRLYEALLELGDDARVLHPHLVLGCLLEDRADQRSHERLRRARHLVSTLTCRLGLMDIPDLGATLRYVYRVLKPRGWFVFVVGHPCFLAPEATTVPAPDEQPGRLVTGYFNERFWRSANSNGVRRAGNYHRTLTTYLNVLLSSGFRLEIVDEPGASPLLSQQQPVYDQVPIFFAARARHPSE